MTLTALSRRYRLTVLGMNSGTSADGVDLSVLRFTTNPSGPAIRFVAGHMVRYPKALRTAVLSAASMASADIGSILHLDNALGQFYGRTAEALMLKLRRQGIAIDAVASHGQTVRHLPRKISFAGYRVNGTMQLGSLDCIAVATGLPVVGDFRQADIALGHEGAPITVAAMAKLFGHPQESRVIVNIGGMANFFYFPSDRSGLDVQAADTGPGNVLCDLLASRLFGKSYDSRGHFAMRGAVSERLLSILLSHGFFGGRRMSTGREEFGPALIADIVKIGRRLRLAKYDLMATAAELTVARIYTRLKPIVQRDRRVDKLYLTGGGVHNAYFKRRLAELFPGLSIESISSLGIDPGLVEASSYAAMGYACLRSEPLQTRFVPGQKQRMLPVLGKIVQPPTRMA
ncbi:MAG: anhydro-N-acetylmuramic acid kinase [Candidatus Zixiibacteriota bacterium]